MASTRFNYDECRTKKQLQQSTDPGRWILNVPGNGINPLFFEDPHIILQKWGGNLRTNTINLESSLLGINKPISRDILKKDNYKNFEASSSQINYPSNNSFYTEETRTTTPAWWFRDKEQNNFNYLPINPQINTCLPFQNNLNTRILEKDYFSVSNCNN